MSNVDKAKNFAALLIILTWTASHAKAAPVEPLYTGEEDEEEDDNNNTHIEHAYLIRSVEKEEEELEDDIIHTRVPRSVTRDVDTRWPDAVVPYAFESVFSAEHRRIISAAFEEFHTNSCVRFRPRQQGEVDYVAISNGGTCSSYVGRMGRGQVVQLNSTKCMRVGKIVHELMHSLGFWHEQARYDRDDFVKVHATNIREEFLENFDKVTKDEMNSFGVRYDYASIMHYSRKAYSKNGKATLEALNAIGNALMGQRIALSKRDILKINKMYPCENSKAKYPAPKKESLH